MHRDGSEIPVLCHCHLGENYADTTYCIFQTRLSLDTRFNLPLPTCLQSSPMLVSSDCRGWRHLHMLLTCTWVFSSDLAVSLASDLDACGSREQLCSASPLCEASNEICSTSPDLAYHFTRRETRACFLRLQASKTRVSRGHELRPMVRNNASALAPRVPSA